TTKNGAGRTPAARTRAPGAAAHSHSSAMLGSAISDSPSLTLKATPIIAAASSDQRNRPFSRACQDSHSAAISSAANSESIVSLRAVSTDIGSTASAAAARAAALKPNGRYSAPNSSPHALTPASASGGRSPTRAKPSALVEATGSQRSRGGLSIAGLPPGSSVPKKKACQ